MRNVMGLVRLAGALAVAVMLVAASGCRVAEVKEQAEAVASAGRVLGVVTAGQPDGGAVVVVLFRRSASLTYDVAQVGYAAADGKFEFTALPGEYYVAAFQDRDGDTRYQAGEPGRFFGDSSPVAVAAGGAVEVAIALSTTGAPLVVEHLDIGQMAAGVRNVGQVTTLDDPRFARENGPLGMWRPLDFMAGPEGGLFLLDEYDPGRMPVLFVHGISATPLDFEAAIAGLDRTRFQPWVLYYPSGMRLDVVSDYLLTAVQTLQQRYVFGRLAIVAHSMGGLVARSFVQKCAVRQPEVAQVLKLFVTVNSPMGGMASAATGVEHAPIVVPSWQDVAAGSEFVRRVAADGWPARIPYHLVFSYSEGDSSDGTVALDSQIPLAQQAEAIRLYGFRGTHVGTLSNPEFIALLNRLLAGVLLDPSETRQSSAPLR